MTPPKQTARVNLRLGTLMFLVVICAQGLALFVLYRRQVRLEARFQVALRAYQPDCLWTIPTEQFKDRCDEKIRDALESPIALRYADGAPLEDVLREVKLATSGPDLPDGIYIYVDPVGLQLAGRSEQTPMRSVAIPEGTSFGGALSRVLEPIGVGYMVKDGMLTITLAEACRP